QLVLSSGLVFDEGELSFNMGPNAVLCITEDTDWTDIDLEFIGDQPIELGENVTLTLTAAQASGLNIVAKAGIDDPLDLPNVVIEGLGAYPDLDDGDNTNGLPTDNDDADELFDYDFSGIQVAASASLFD